MPEDYDIRWKTEPFTSCVILPTDNKTKKPAAVICKKLY